MSKILLLVWVAVLAFLPQVTVRDVVNVFADSYGYSVQWGPFQPCYEGKQQGHPEKPLVILGCYDKSVSVRTIWLTREGYNASLLQSDVQPWLSVALFQVSLAELQEVCDTRSFSREVVDAYAQTISRSWLKHKPLYSVPSDQAVKAVNALQADPSVGCALAANVP